jgi:hypothetical protein
LIDKYAQTTSEESEYDLSNNKGNLVLDRLYSEVSSEKYSDELRLLVQRFEVSKRIYSEYDKDLRPININNYNDISLYIRFAEILNSAYEGSKELYYLNALLKVMDILFSEKSNLSSKEVGRLSRLVCGENKHISNLGKLLGIQI